MLSEHVAYLRMIRFIDAELNGVCGNRRLFDLAVFSLAGIREMFVDFSMSSTLMSRFYIAFFFGQAE